MSRKLAGVGGRFGPVCGSIVGVVVACLCSCAVAGATQIASGGAHSCVVTSSGHVDCWGANESGQLGDGTTTNSDVPVEARGVANAVEVAAGEGDSCVLLSSGRIDCWGSNIDGALGNGSTPTESDTPVEVEGIADAVQVAVGFKHSCAALANGHVDCWGDEVVGHIGVPREKPVEVAGIEHATQVAAGRSDSCALLASGHVECWEENEDGQLGDGETGASEVPVEVHGVATATQIVAGRDHVCALLSSSHVSCWGGDESGQLGDGATDNADTPIEVSGVTNATQITAGGEDSCALMSNGQTDCWGENFYGQLGNGTIEGADTPVEAHGVSGAAQVAAGGQHSCALLPGDRVECWGDNESDQLGNGLEGGDRDTPVGVQGLSTAVQVAVGYPHACAVLASGHIACWGENALGQLGDGSNERSQTPDEVPGVTDAVQVAEGEFDSCAVLSSGHVECWGADYFESGQLGNGARESSTTPVEVKGLTSATQVATATYGSCALLSSGHVECWGNDEGGELGDGTRGGSSDTPVEVQGIVNATGVAAGEYHFCATLSGGRVDCWGNNSSGQLGDGSTAESSDTPVEVSGLTSAVQVVAGYEHSCALLSSGHVDCWGANVEGELGGGTLTGPESCPGSGSICSRTPVEVQGLAGAAQVATGGNDSCALLSSGRVDCWGGDMSGQLGDGVIGDLYGSSDTPVEVQGLSGARQIAAGGNQDYAALGSACAVLANGQVECWGSNHSGALGDGFAWSTLPDGVVGFSPTAGGGETVTPSPQPSQQPSVHSGSATATSSPSASAPADPKPSIGQGGDVAGAAGTYASVLSLSASATQKGKLSLTLACRGASRCTGTVSIAIVERKKARESETVLLASARYELRPGSGKIVLALGSTARALLAKGGVLHTTATVTTIGATTRTERTSRLTIRAAKR